jgi:hypothetical protein
MDGSRSAQTIRESGLLLDADSTRQELNPYLPTAREDFQFSLGDRRLGIGAPGESPYNTGRGSVRGLSTRSAGASSLAPALAVPLPNAAFTTPNRQAGQIQFPSRKF